MARNPSESPKKKPANPGHKRDGAPKQGKSRDTGKQPGQKSKRSPSGIKVSGGAAGSGRLGTTV